MASALAKINLVPRTSCVRLQARQTCCTSASSAASLSALLELPVLEFPNKDATTDERTTFARSLVRTAHEIGFFYLAVDDDDGVRARVLESTREFFALPLEEKLQSDYRQSPD